MSHRLLLGAITVLALLFFGAGLADAQRGKSGSNRDKKSASKKADTFAVVKVGDKYEVVAKSELKAFKKKVGEQHRAEVKAYSAAKKAAAKAKEKFTEKKPKAPKVSVVKKGFKSESQARTAAERLTEKQSRSGAGGKSAAPKADAWVVASVDGNLRVMRKSELAEAKKRSSSAFRDAMADWNDAKKKAARTKTKFDEPRPKKSIIKSAGGPFKSEEAARARCDKLRAKPAKKATRAKGGTGSGGKKK